MPGPRRRKPPAHHFPPLDLPPGATEEWIIEWFTFGWLDLVHYLTCHYGFAEYLDNLERKDSS